jgi:glycosyltransferase involved in cell wall biosynthesis
VGAYDVSRGDAAARPRLRLIAGFESTYAPLGDADGFETTRHDERWRTDLGGIAAAGVRDVRYPLRWHRIETAPGRYDWTGTDAVLEHLRELGLRPVVDLLHHTSHPAWLTDGFADPRFPASFERFAAQVAARYPWIDAYTVINEPLATLFLAGHEALWRAPIRVARPLQDHTAVKKEVPAMSAAPDLVVLSHLRWSFVWQRPQHLITRLTDARSASGGHTWFVEEPEATTATDRPRIRTELRGNVTRVWLEVPAGDDLPEGRLDFGVPAARDYTDLLRDLLAAHTAEPEGPHPGPPKPAPHVWLYTPMALDIAEALEPALLVYDVMDDLAAFANAPMGLRLRQRRALRIADVVLAGGRSLHASVAPERPDAHLFPSGVDSAHYARSRALRAALGPRPRHPVAGFVGVLDERLDVDLVAAVARLLPDWELRFVGPVAEFKFDAAALPQAPNLTYPGRVDYEQLPGVMAGLDVAIMPFALNEATRSISPTKTLEYLAAGLPVVSTPVPDVVAGFPGLVHVAGTPEEFAAACRTALTEPLDVRDRRMRRIEQRYQWDEIAARIHQILEDAANPAAAAERSADASA